MIVNKCITVNVLPSEKKSLRSTEEKQIMKLWNFTILSQMEKQFNSGLSYLYQVMGLSLHNMVLIFEFYAMSTVELFFVIFKSF